MAKHPAIVH